MTDRFALVALPLPLATPGARVVVPVRRRELIGIVTGVDAPAPVAAARDLLAAPDPEPAIPPALLAAG